MAAVDSDGAAPRRIGRAGHRAVLARWREWPAASAETFIADCRTLHEALGLSAVNHLAPSSLDVRTLRACATHLPDAFLLNIGYTAEEIHSLKTLYTEPTR